jgi:hypothetical protein
MQAMLQYDRNTLLACNHAAKDRVRFAGLALTGAKDICCVPHKSVRIEPVFRHEPLTAC